MPTLARAPCIFVRVMFLNERKIISSGSFAAVNFAATPTQKGEIGAFPALLIHLQVDPPQTSSFSFAPNIQRSFASTLQQIWRPIFKLFPPTKPIKMFQR